MNHHPTTLSVCCATFYREGVLLYGRHIFPSFFSHLRFAEVFSTRRKWNSMRKIYIKKKRGRVKERRWWRWIVYITRTRREKEKYIIVCSKKKRRRKRDVLGSSLESDLYSFVGSCATLQESFLRNIGERGGGGGEKSRLFKTRKSPWKGRFSGLHFSVTGGYHSLHDPTSGRGE